jgi:hypothetical protein
MSIRGSTTGATAVDGPTRFARFAYPPNVLGYCGTDDHRALLEYSASGTADGGLRRIARTFEGAWPYLELIAGANGITDPLDARVVDAYWIGNALTQRVPASLLGESVTERFRGPAGRDFAHLAETIPEGALPTHGFHVFAIYPWVGLLRSGATDNGLFVLDRCRIRWGRVERVEGDEAVVRARPLTWDGSVLALGLPVPERVTVTDDGLGLVPGVEAGAWVAMHWGWVCDRLEPHRLRALVQFTAATLDLVNRRVAHPPAAAILG